MRVFLIFTIFFCYARVCLTQAHATLFKLNMNTAATAAAAAYCLSVFYLIFFFKRVQQGLVFLQKKNPKKMGIAFFRFGF